MALSSSKISTSLINSHISTEKGFQKEPYMPRELALTATLRSLTTSPNTPRLEFLNQLEKKHPFLRDFPRLPERKVHLIQKETREVSLLNSILKKEIGI